MSKGLYILYAFQWLDFIGVPYANYGYLATLAFINA